MRKTFRNAVVAMALACVGLAVLLDPDLAGTLRSWGLPADRVAARMDTVLNQATVGLWGDWVRAAAPWPSRGVGAAILMLSLYPFFGPLRRGFNALRRKASEMAMNRRLAAVRVEEVECRITSADRTEHPGTVVYPDAQDLRLDVRIRWSRGFCGEPMAIGLYTAAADGQVLRLDEARSHAIGGRGDRIGLSINGITRRLGRGEWELEVRLETNGRILYRLPICVVDRETMICDLELREPRMLVAGYGQTVPSWVVFSDCDTAFPAARIVPRTLDPSRYGPIVVRAELARAGRVASAAIDMSVSLDAESRGVCGVEIPVRGGAIDDEGDWECRFVVEGAMVGSVPFRVVAAAAADQAIEVESFDIMVEDVSGRVSRLGDSPRTPQLRSAAPVLQVHNRFPSAVPRYEVVIGVESADGEIGSVGSRVALPQASNQVVSGELRLGEPGDSRWTGEVTFFAIINGRYVATRKATLAAAMPRVADAQGRLLRSAKNISIDVDEEAEALIRLAEPR